MNIDFTTDRYVCGEFGEHNAESLVVSIPQDMQNAGSAYRLAFLGVASLSPVRTHPLTPENNKVTYPLPQSVTSMREADMTLEEYNGDDLLRKSTMVRLVFNCAVPDGDESINESPTLVEEITANTAARHTHANKTVLDKFGESEGAPTYDGDPIGGTALVEILQQGSYARYTATELIALYVEGKIFTYGGNIVTNIRTASNLFTFSVLEYEVYNSIKTPVLRSYSVNSSKQIIPEADAKSQLFLPYSVNGKTFVNANAVTLKAADITASAGWSPTNDLDLATKKYVDENGGGGSDLPLVVENNKLCFVTD